MNTPKVKDTTIIANALESVHMHSYTSEECGLVANLIVNKVGLRRTDGFNFDLDDGVLESSVLQLCKLTSKFGLLGMAYIYNAVPEDNKVCYPVFNTHILIKPALCNIITLFSDIGVCVSLGGDVSNIVTEELPGLYVASTGLPKPVVIK